MDDFKDMAVDEGTGEKMVVVDTLIATGHIDEDGNFVPAGGTREEITTYVQTDEDVITV